MSTPPITIWRKLWLIWLAQFLVIELPAAVWTYQAHGTLSVTVWSAWFTGWTVWILVSFLAVLSAHFVDRGRHWWSSGRAVAIAALPVVAVILSREVDMGWLKKVGGALWGGLKKLGTWALTSKNVVLKYGPQIGGAILGIAGAFPGTGVAKTIAQVVAGLLTQSGTGVDTSLVASVTQLVVAILGVITAWGVVRKNLGPKVAQPALPPAK